VNLALFVACCGCAAQIWDVSRLKRTRTMTGHRQRVGTQVRLNGRGPA